MGYPAATRSAFQYGLVIFTLTALLGLANATQLFGALDRNTLLTHLHSGTLGWITMGVIGLSIWIFGGSGTTLARNVMVSAVATAAYVLAFWSGNFQARALFGTIELLVVLYWWWFAVSRAMIEGFGRLDIPKLSVLIVSPRDTHVPTLDAYRWLKARPLTLTKGAADPKLWMFCALCWSAQGSGLSNDFERPVFQRHPRLDKIKRVLLQRGAAEASLAGSGSAVFGVFPSPAQARRAAVGFPDDQTFVCETLSRDRYVRKMQGTR